MSKIEYSKSIFVLAVPNESFDSQISLIMDKSNKLFCILLYNSINIAEKLQAQFTQKWKSQIQKNFLQKQKHIFQEVSILPSVLLNR